LRLGERSAGRRALQASEKSSAPCGLLGGGEVRSTKANGEVVRSMTRAAKRAAARAARRARLGSGVAAGEAGVPGVRGA